jgi:hypothetical protein
MYTWYYTVDSKREPIYKCLNSEHPKKANIKKKGEGAYI